MVTTRRIKIYFDGGCRPNPGKMETAVVTGGAAVVVRDAGIGSSQDAEWLALIAALRLARDLELTNFILLGDAAAVVAQANGAVRARGDGEIASLCDQAQAWFHARRRNQAGAGAPAMDAVDRGAGLCRRQHRPATGAEVPCSGLGWPRFLNRSISRT